MQAGMRFFLNCWNWFDPRPNTPIQCLLIYGRVLIFMLLFDCRYLYHRLEIMRVAPYLISESVYRFSVRFLIGQSGPFWWPLINFIFDLVSCQGDIQWPLVGPIGFGRIEIGIWVFDDVQQKKKSWQMFRRHRTLSIEWQTLNMIQRTQCLNDLTFHKMITICNMLFICSQITTFFILIFR